jgi:flavin reductase (DIM6/NTAB) family NADH-FMN oxidoreductase RutF
MPLDVAEFRHTMSQLVSGVTIVTVRTPSGVALGMTASSVTSLSLDPPLLLVCVGKEAVLYEPLLHATRFGVNVLAAQQDGLARRFAVRERQKLTEQEVRLSPGGVPILADALAQIECEHRAHFSAGDHSIVTGTVEWSAVGEGWPLCYFRGDYAELGE